MSSHKWSRTWSKVIPKKLWIVQVIHALTVPANRVIHALTVPPLRINGPGTNKEPVLPVINTPVVGASPFVHNPVGLHTNRLALATDNLLKS